MENMQNNELKDEATLLDLTAGTSHSISKQFHTVCKFKGFIWIMLYVICIHMKQQGVETFSQAMTFHKSSSLLTRLTGDAPKMDNFRQSQNKG